MYVISWSITKTSCHHQAGHLNEMKQQHKNNSNTSLWLMTITLTWKKLISSTRSNTIICQSFINQLLTLGYEEVFWDLMWLMFIVCMSIIMEWRLWKRNFLICWCMNFWASLRYVVKISTKTKIIFLLKFWEWSNGS